MTVRAPAVAGMFYEGTADRLRRQVDGCFAEYEQQKRESFIGAVVPHAGLMYSGAVAASFYGQADLPERLIILGPNHTGLGIPGAVSAASAWRTPYAEAAIDQQLATELTKATRTLRFDDAAHLREHSIEVQLPLIQRELAAFRFVPVCLAIHQFESCEEAGNAVAQVIRESGGRIGILASSDFNHYEDQAETIRKDNLAIEAILALDPRELWRRVREFDISMCGFIPTTVMLVAARALGASTARLIRHATSGDVNGDYDRVVGYASIVIK